MKAFCNYLAYFKSLISRQSNYVIFVTKMMILYHHHTSQVKCMQTQRSKFSENIGFIKGDRKCLFSIDIPQANQTEYRFFSLHFAHFFLYIVLYIFPKIIYNLTINMHRRKINWIVSISSFPNHLIFFIEMVQGMQWEGV